MSAPRVLVVRSGANPFAHLPEARGIEVVERASHSILPLEVPASTFDSHADLTIFTSQVTVERLLSDERLAPALRRAVAGGRVVALGRSTEAALRRHRLSPDIVAKGSGESILDHVAGRLDGLHVLLPGAEDATPELPDALSRRGALVTRVAVYRKVPAPHDADLAHQIVDQPFIAFCVTSPSAATWLFAGLSHEAAQRLRDTPAVVLGRYTRRYLESHGVAQISVTEEPRFAAAARMLETLARVPPTQ
ncbi:MAG: uroporphyrinogen-III synthase [Acidobacteriota bacterium]